MPTRLPELSYRLAHHLPEALPFIVPFYNKLAVAGFDIDERKIKPVLRRNGRRLVTDYHRDQHGVSVTFRFYDEHAAILTVDLKALLHQIQAVRSVQDYGDIDRQIDGVVHALERATTSSTASAA